MVNCLLDEHPAACNVSFNRSCGRMLLQDYLRKYSLRILKSQFDICKGDSIKLTVIGK